ncbi:type ISP restriction/modification enzyme [Nocardia inohanensis]|uniref:type ISP restriction/modification enzyme n=1 Tax=Nocardia inohanensis TaxID=209246 RepID=UPI001C3FE27D|nr:type ISP restriction/modification enzyme [Nocardia inohanensis]
MSKFGAAVGPRLRAGAGGAEHQLSAPFCALIDEVAGVLGVEVMTVAETALPPLGVRPDFMVNVAGARVGYAELKAPGRKVPTLWKPNAHEQAQWDKLSLLPNVLYTDGTHWAVYRYGALSGQVAMLDGDLRKADAKLHPADSEFERVMIDFLGWKPDPPRSITQLVRAVANLCRLLRDEVRETLAREQAGTEPEPLFTGLAEDWRQYMFPGLSDAEFADSYAQTVVFALLLARVDGISFDGQTLAQVAELLGKKHSLMGRSLAVLTAHGVEERSVVVTTLQRVIGAVDWDTLSRGNTDTYLHFYEHFLEQYDASLRQQSGSYYTPNEVVSFMVGFVDELLRERLDKPWGFATDDVQIIDPAMGTGTYLLNIVDRVARTVADEEGPGAVPPQLRALFRRLIGFELQTGPFAVAELRVHQALKADHKTEIPEKEVQFYIANTLDDPYAEQTYIPSILEQIARSRSEANKVKREVKVQVVIGNPPYRERAKGLGGWVESGSGQRGETTPLSAFRAKGLGKYENVLSNLYVYFWRWATWKVFDAHPDSPAGIVAFITPSSFTTGKGHSGMREYLRRTADEGWIIDVSPEEHQPPINTRVFPGVQHHLCIAVFVRYGHGDRDQPARVHYRALHGTRAEKFAELTQLTPGSVGWMTTSDGWHEVFSPRSDSEWENFPALGELMPWSQTGVTPNRNWVHAPSIDTLNDRWRRLIRAQPENKADLMKETGDRTLTKIPPALPGQLPTPVALGAETSEIPPIEPMALRSFDRQYVVYDARVVDRARPPLWEVRNLRQVYVTEQHAHPITSGPGLVFTELVPSVHHFNGRGGRVLPLYRDSGGFVPNIAPGLLTALTARLGVPVSAEDFLAYIAAVVAHPAYTSRFVENLRTPGIRVPLTTDPTTWTEAVTVGREVLWLHTSGNRYTDPAQGRPRRPRLAADRKPQVVTGIPDSTDGMPDAITYTPETETLHLGTGTISPVPQVVWEYEVSGLRVIKHWFDYRKRLPRSKRTSPLDDVNPEHWPAKFTTELLDLLNVLGRCVELHERQSNLLDQVCSGPLFGTADLTHAGVLPVPDSVRTHVPSPDQPTLL